jgi:hypothetical protein
MLAHRSASAAGVLRHLSPLGMATTAAVRSNFLKHFQEISFSPAECTGICFGRA